MKRKNMLALAAVVLTSAMPCRAQTPAEPEFARAEQSVAVFAKKATELRSLPQGPDVPGIRETVRRLEIHVSRTCLGTAPRYALKPVAADLGPSLPAYADSLHSSYFYPNGAGLRLELAGDGPGAALSIGSAQGAMRALGTIAPEDGPCRPYSSVPARLEIAAGVSATISVAPRTGFFHPACYKDPINGFHKLDTWTILTIVLPQETLTVKAADGMSFRDKQSCLDYYERARTNRSKDALNAAWTQTEKITQGVSAVRGVTGGGYPASLVVGESFVKGEANGGYPVDLRIDRTENTCLIEGTFNGGYLARMRLEDGRARGEAMGGYPIDLMVSETSVTGVVQGGYRVKLAISANAVEGTVSAGYPLKLEIVGSLDACRLTAALLPLIHRPRLKS